MKKLHVICHMASTVDGRIITSHWGDKETTKEFSALYEQCHNSFDSQAWMCGRVTMEKDFSKGEQPDRTPPPVPIPREPFIGDKEATSFAIAVDPGGKLGWKDNAISGDHLIEILTESVDDGYLHYLRGKNISYLFAGRDEIDFASALNQLAEHFPIQTLMLEGGGHINGSLLHAHLIDELSLLVLPLADGAPGTPTTFELGDRLPAKPATRLHLSEVKQLGHDVIWIKYKA